MRHTPAIAALCLLAACDPSSTTRLPDAEHLSGSSLTLLIAVRGRGEVTHTADLAGITSCSTIAPNPEKADCTRSFELNAAVTLQPNAPPGWSFDHWSGVCAGKVACALTMNERRVLEAIFKAIVVTPPSYTVTLVVRGRGEVTHVPDLAGATSCSTLAATSEVAECRRTFTAGSEIVLTPRADAGYRFAGWAGACTAAGTGACTLRMNENRTLELRFEKQ